MAIEDVSDSFLERNYGETAGELYKPESSQFDGMNAGGGADREMPDMDDGITFEDGDWTMPEDGQFTIPEAGDFTGSEDGQFTLPVVGDFTVDEDDQSTLPGVVDRAAMGMGGFGGSSSGASLQYTDDETSSYSDIFDNAETDADDEDMQRVIAALKQLSTGEDLASCIDVEAVWRYFVAHNFVLNFDSYTGSMPHNYYLYEEDGVLTMLPWDYNLQEDSSACIDASEISMTDMGSTNNGAGKNFGGDLQGWGQGQWPGMQDESDIEPPGMTDEIPQEATQ